MNQPAARSLRTVAAGPACALLHAEYVEELSKYVRATAVVDLPAIVRVNVALRVCPSISQALLPGPIPEGKFEWWKEE